MFVGSENSFMGDPRAEHWRKMFFEPGELFSFAAWRVLDRQQRAARSRSKAEGYNSLPALYGILNYWQRCYKAGLIRYGPYLISMFLGIVIGCIKIGSLQLERQDVRVSYAHTCSDFAVEIGNNAIHITKYYLGRGDLDAHASIVTRRCEPVKSNIEIVR